MQHVAKSLNRSTRPFGRPSPVALLLVTLLMALGACSDGPVAPVQVESDPEVLVAGDPLHSPSSETCDPLYEEGRTCDGGGDDPIGGEPCTPLARSCHDGGGGGGTCSPEIAACGRPGGGDGGFGGGDSMPVMSDDDYGTQEGLPTCSQPKNDHERSWCAGDDPDAVQEAKIRDALNRIKARAGICETIANRGLAILGAHNLHLFEPRGFDFDDSRFWGLGYPDWIVLAHQWVDDLDRPRSEGYNLEHALVHEVDHSLYAEDAHIPGGSVYDTIHTDECS